MAALRLSMSGQRPCAAIRPDKVYICTISIYDIYVRYLYMISIYDVYIRYLYTICIYDIYIQYVMRLCRSHGTRHPSSPFEQVPIRRGQLSRGQNLVLGRIRVVCDVSMLSMVLCIGVVRVHPGSSCQWPQVLLTLRICE